MKQFTSFYLVLACLLAEGSLRAQQSAPGRQPERASVAVSAAVRTPPAIISPGQVNSGATVPRLIKFSGVLQDVAGKPIAGPVDVTFSLYSEQAGGSPWWFETQTVEADSLGQYNVLLGAMTPTGVPMELFTGGEARWLGVQVSNLPEQPRVLLVSVPYAMKAGDAETLGGRPASEYQLNPQAETSSRATKRSGTTTTREGATSSSTASKSQRITSSTITATPNYIPVFTNSDGSMNNSVMYQSSGRIGIGTTTPFYGLDINANVIAVGTTVPKSGFGGSLRFRDDTGTPRWLFGMLGSAGATTFNVSDMINHYQPFIAQPGAPTNSLVLTPTGVGIGTATPAAELDVNGNINIPQTATGGATGVITVGGASFIHFCCSNLNMFVGLDSGNFTNTGVINTGVGADTLVSDTIGGYNTALGSFALAANTTGADNTAAGEGALADNSTGTQNAAFGMGALGNSSTAGNNTAAGYFALVENTLGSNNTAVGSDALFYNSDAGANTAVGKNALFHTCYHVSPTCTANGNTAVGGWAGESPLSSDANITGSYNTFIGYNTGPGTATQLTNATALGANAVVSASNAMVLGKTGVKVGIGTSVPDDFLDVSIGGSGPTDSGMTIEGSSSSNGDLGLKIHDTGSGGVNWYLDSTNSASAYGGGFLAIVPNPGAAGAVLYVHSGPSVGIGTNSTAHPFTVCFQCGAAYADAWDTYSSRRFKTNIHTLRHGLATVERLRGVTYNQKSSGKPEIGVIAEEVEQVLPEVVGHDKKGRADGVDYSRLTAVLIQAVKEQQQEISGLKRSSAAKNARLNSEAAQLRTLSVQNRGLAHEVRQLRAAESGMATLEARLSRDEAQQRATRVKLARVAHRQKKKGGDELARVQF
jgi:Chaperone of endosialidase